MDTGYDCFRTELTYEYESVYKRSVHAVNL